MVTSRGRGHLRRERAAQQSLERERGCLNQQCSGVAVVGGRAFRELPALPAVRGLPLGGDRSGGDGHTSLGFGQKLTLKVGEQVKPIVWQGEKQSILKEIIPEYSLEGLMLKLQYFFGHLMQRSNS